MFSLARIRKQHNQRSDGYTDRVARIVCQFQAAVEREPDCDYFALRSALVWARLPGRPVTMQTLRFQYNEYRFVSAEMAYSSR